MEILDNKAKYYSRVDDVRPRLNCWEHVTAPQGWTVPDLITILNDSDDDSADSVDHNDADPEPDTDEDAFLLPEA